MNVEEKWSKFFYQSSVCALAAATGVLYNITQRAEPLTSALSFSLFLACLALPISILCIYKWLTDEYKNDALLEKLHSATTFATLISVHALVYHHSKIAALALFISSLAGLFLTRKNNAVVRVQPEA